MKRNDKDNAEYIRNKLQPINERVSLPDELSAENIAELVSGKEHNKSKKGKIIAFRAIGSIAATILIAIGIGTAVNYFNRPAVNKIPDIVAEAQKPISSNTEKTIVDYFTALRAKYEKEEIFYVFDALGDFGDKYESAAEGAAPEGSSGTNTNSSVTFDLLHGTTNTQVKDVDEDDIIKNDGKYIYVLTDSSIKIIDAANMKLMSKLSIESRGSNGLYILGNKLIAVGSTFDKKQQTVIEIYNITDKSSPELMYTFEQDGVYFSSRLIGNRIVLLSQHAVYPEDIELDGGYAVYNDIVPTITENGVAVITLSPEMITILPHQDNYSEIYTVMTSLDLSTDVFDPITSAVLGTGDNVYCTAENLYITDTKYTYSETTHSNGMISVSDHSVKTAIHRFSIKNGVIKSEATGEVNGRTLNQFSLDEKGGYLRIATTDNSANEITVLDKSLKEIAKIDDIAEGETIQSVRYIGDYGYVVTFRQTDPLFVIDFKDMKNPKIVGELKIPGFSSYLHPFNGYLVGIGTDGDEDGTVNALKISLFDISDPTNPQEIDRFIVKNAYAESYHKTVMDYAAKDILGFIYRDYNTGEAKLCTLRIKEGKIELIGSYSNRSEEEGQTGTVYTPDGESELIYYDKTSYKAASIERATYIGDTLYAVSAHRICSYPIEGGNVIAMLDF